LHCVVTANEGLNKRLPSDRQGQECAILTSFSTHIVP
jgi:hypothetical protein